jgi:hypothetical protein
MRNLTIASTLLIASGALISACSAPNDLDNGSSDALTRAIAAQSIQHGTARAGTSSNFLLVGKAGDEILPDVWPTTGAAANNLVPTLKVFGPMDASGTRPLLATGSPTSDGPTHISLQLELPQSGNYLIVVGATPLHSGRFSLRLWDSASHAPRAEAMQVPLLLVPGDAVEAALAQHDVGGPSAGTVWNSDELAALGTAIAAETDPLAALSDCALVYSTLVNARNSNLATDALVSMAQGFAAAQVGSSKNFSTLPPSTQTFALYWLGIVQPAVFASEDQTVNEAQLDGPLAGVTSRIHALVAGWPDAVEQVSSRKITALTHGGETYGFAADWSAVQLDEDGQTQLFSWQSSDYFSASGSWIGESSYGAGEPDDGD